MSDRYRELLAKPTLDLRDPNVVELWTQALDIYTQHAWTAAMLFHDAAKRAGANLSRDTLIQALNSTQGFETGWSVPLSYGPGNHDPNHCFTYTSHVGGNWHTESGWVCS